MNKIILISSVLMMLLGGCAATMEQVPGSVEKSKYAPVNAEQQYGLISYDKSDGDSAREDAYKQMYETCKGKYKVIGEYQKSEGSVYVPYGKDGKYGGAMVDIEKVFIKFLCVK